MDESDLTVKRSAIIVWCHNLKDIVIVDMVQNGKAGVVLGLIFCRFIEGIFEGRSHPATPTTGAPPVFPFDN